MSVQFDNRSAESMEGIFNKGRGSADFSTIKVSNEASKEDIRSIDSQ